MQSYGTRGTTCWYSSTTVPYGTGTSTYMLLAVYLLHTVGARSTSLYSPIESALIHQRESTVLYCSKTNQKGVPHGCACESIAPHGNSTGTVRYHNTVRLRRTVIYKNRTPATTSMLPLSPASEQIATRGRRRIEMNQYVLSLALPNRDSNLAQVYADCLA